MLQKSQIYLPAYLTSQRFKEMIPARSNTSPLEPFRHLADIFSRPPGEQLLVDVFHARQFSSTPLRSVTVGQEQCTIRATAIELPRSNDAPAGMWRRPYPIMHLIQTVVRS